MSYYDKYSKYKNKYISLRNQMDRRQRGGGNGSPFPLEDEIHFWGRQMMEHALFLHLGLEEANLKAEAMELHNKWKRFLDKDYYSKGIKVGPETIELSSDDLQKVDINIEKVNAMIEHTEKFKSKVIRTLGEGKWIGWIFPALALHMMKEAQYFKRKVNGPAFAPGEEIKFINEHHGEEMGTTAQLIDPNPAQQPIIDLVRSYGLKAMSKYNAGQMLADSKAPVPFPAKDWTAEQEAVIKDLTKTDEGNMLLLSIKYGDELTKFADATGKMIEANQLKSIISPILAHHVHREFARFTQTLKKLQ